jgi:ABC-2 type transport system permease protein
MNKVWQIAAREFVATVFTKGFVIGLLVVPVIGAILAIVGPRLFGDRSLSIEGEVVVVDPTGVVLPRVRDGIASRRSPAAVTDIVGRARAGGAEDIVLDVLGATARLTLVERAATADIEEEKRWLTEPAPAAPHLALVVVHSNAVEPAAGRSDLGSYDLFVPSKQDNRIEITVQGLMREAIIDARTAARDLNREELSRVMTVPRVSSVSVGVDGERDTVFGLNIVVPAVFMGLLIMGVMFAGQGMLTTTVEEKSNRVIEVLLSAVSPMQLMGGKLVGHMGISLLAMSLYLGLGLVALASFSLFGLLDPALLLYLLVFFVIAFFTIGSLMMAVGAAVNDMREAQTLMMPLMFVIILPWLFWMPIVRDPNSTLAVVVSLVPPVSSFGMLLRLASSSPPPAWQVWLSIALGIAGVFGSVWIAAKVFRVGILMFGKPPDLKTLVKWLRTA